MIANLIAERPEDDDTARFAAMSPEERLALCLELCELANSIVDGRPDSEALRRGHPRSAESLALWRLLMRAGARDRPR